MKNKMIIAVLVLLSTLSATPLKETTTVKDSSGTASAIQVSNIKKMSCKKLKTMIDIKEESSRMTEVKNAYGRC